MNIFGVGGAELVLIFIIMLVVAGPQRMLRWAYLFGQFVSKLRVVWDNVTEIIQAEIDAAGMDMEIPKELPTRRGITDWVNEQTRDVTSPLKKDLERIEGTLGQAKRDLGAWNKPRDNNQSTAADDSGQSAPKTAASENGSSGTDSAFGSWTGAADTSNGTENTDTSAENGFGAWANPQPPGKQTRQQEQKG